MGRYWPAFAGAMLLAAPALAQTAGAPWDAPLAAHGITLGVSDTENLLGAVSGGVKQGATLQGTASATLGLDTEKAFGLPGGTLQISALQIHGRALSPSYLADIQTANGFEAEDTTRLWELWYDQSFLGGKFDLKLGQQSIDNEFMTSANAGLFVNTMAGWPVVPSYDLFGGGPAYPLSSPGLRLRAVQGNFTLLTGVFDDNPGGGAFTDDAQHLDGAGTRFNLNTGALWIAELQYNTKIAGLPGTYKLGGWYDSGQFPAQSAWEGGVAALRGDESAYFVADQTIWQSRLDSNQALNLFGRVMGAPDDRNEIDLGFTGGLTLTAPLPRRESDEIGIDLGIARVSSQADPSAVTQGGTETLLEITYQAKATSWLTLQPDLQYIFTPGGGIPNPAVPGEQLQNELVAGFRANVSF